MAHLHANDDTTLPVWEEVDPADGRGLRWVAGADLICTCGATLAIAGQQMPTGEYPVGDGDLAHVVRGRGAVSRGTNWLPAGGWGGNRYAHRHEHLVCRCGNAYSTELVESAPWSRIFATTIGLPAHDPVAGPLPAVRNAEFRDYPPGIYAAELRVPTDVDGPAGQLTPIYASDWEEPADVARRRQMDDYRRESIRRIALTHHDRPTRAAYAAEYRRRYGEDASA